MKKLKVFSVILAYLPLALLSLGLGFASCVAPVNNTTYYTVTFSANGGNGAAPAAQTVSSGSSITIPNGSGLSRSGDTFGGWNTNADGTGTNYSAGLSYTPTGNITLYAKWNAASAINDVAVTVTAPVEGAAPDTTANSTGNFTVGAVTWMPADNTFIVGKEYTATLTLTANNGYAFSGNLSSATVNGQDATVSSNTGAAVTLSYTFPEMDARTVISITIKTQPDKLTYTHDDQLDLTGLVVTLTHDDTTEEDVTAAEFANRNITASPAQGANLVHSTHNGQPVTITYGELTPLDTNNLTVNKAAGSFGNPAAVNVTYASGLTLDDVTLPAGYAWDAPTTTLNIGNNQSFDAVYTDPSGNHEPAGGIITVNVAKADGAAVTRPEVSGTPTINSITVSVVSLETATGQSIEYAISTANDANVFYLTWQTSATFTSLNSGTAYYVYARSVSNSNYNTGAANVSAAISTMQTVPQGNIIYYWVDQHDSLVTTGGGTSTAFQGQTLTITAEGAGYVVKQWYLNGVLLTGTSNTFNFSSMTAGQHTVGLFVEKGGKLYNTNIIITVQAIIQFTVTFDVNDGSGIVSSRSVPVGTSITLPDGSELSRSGYVFGGWNANAEGTGTNYSGLYTPTANTILYAKWLPTYTVTFDANEGSGTVPSRSAAVGNSITLPDVSGLSRSGYVFGGWNASADGTGTNYSTGSSYTPSGNITLYARWYAGGTEASPILLTANTWVDGSITATAYGSAVWYSVDAIAEAGRNYYIWWNDSKQGNDTKTLDVRVSVYNYDGSIMLSMENVDSGWTNFQAWSYSSGSGTTRTIKIKVTPYSSGSTGTFAIVYSTGSTRP